jgi:hypothetical protein
VSFLLEIFKKAIDKTKNKSNQQFPRACQLEKIEKQWSSVKPIIKKMASPREKQMQDTICLKKCIHIQATDKGA